MAKHIVKCSICHETFDASEVAYVKTASNRYAHADCAETKGLNLPIYNPAVLETCIYCKKQLDKTKEQFKELSKGKFAHLSCWEENKDKLTDREKLEIYINNLYGTKKINPKINRQLKDFVENYGYSYSGIHKALKYWYEVKGNKFDLVKTGGGIAIVGYIYQQAYNYYYAIWEAQQTQKNSLEMEGIENFIPKTIEVTIPVPKRQPQKRQLFTFLDNEGDIDGV